MHVRLIGSSRHDEIRAPRLPIWYSSSQRLGAVVHSSRAVLALLLRESHVAVVVGQSRREKLGDGLFAYRCDVLVEPSRSP